MKVERNARKWLLFRHSSTKLYDFGEACRVICELNIKLISFLSYSYFSSFSKCGAAFLPQYGYQRQFWNLKYYCYCGLVWFGSAHQLFPLLNELWTSESVRQVSFRGKKNSKASWRVKTLFLMEWLLKIFQKKKSEKNGNLCKEESLEFLLIQLVFCEQSCDWKWLVGFEISNSTNIFYL